MENRVNIYLSALLGTLIEIIHISRFYNIGSNYFIIELYRQEQYWSWLNVSWCTVDLGLVTFLHTEKKIRNGASGRCELAGSYIHREWKKDVKKPGCNCILCVILSCYLPLWLGFGPDFFPLLILGWHFSPSDATSWLNSFSASPLSTILDSYFSLYKIQMTQSSPFFS
jgi:hypothetical protein